MMLDMGIIDGKQIEEDVIGSESDRNFYSAMSVLQKSKDGNDSENWQPFDLKARHSSFEKCCHYCGKLGDLQKCGGCYKKPYCSRECQVKDRKYHKSECKSEGKKS